MAQKTATSPITKETRRESYEKTSKHTLQNAVLQVLKEYEALTAREVGIMLAAAGYIGTASRSAIQPRITELVQAGEIEACGKKFDSTTNRNVAVYRVVR